MWSAADSAARRTEPQTEARSGTLADRLVARHPDLRRPLRLLQEGGTWEVGSRAPAPGEAAGENGRVQGRYRQVMETFTLELTVSSGAGRSTSVEETGMVIAGTSAMVAGVGAMGGK
jgi:hypothetical protein